jgi:hypothetical protein
LGFVRFSWPRKIIRTLKIYVHDFDFRFHGNHVLRLNAKRDLQKTIVAVFPACQRRGADAFSRKKILQFARRGMILCGGGQKLGVPPLGLNRFLTTKF